MGANGASVDAQLLAPEQVFIVETETLPGEILLHWTIAPGYFLYRDRFRFSALGDELVLDTPILPAGQIKQDEYFGEVEILRDRFTIAIPYDATGSGAIQVLAVSQGCSDLGVCYPPYEQFLTVSLAASAPGNVDYSLLSAGFAPKSEFLAPDHAFALSTRFGGGGAVVAEWEIADGYYLYRKMFSASVSENSAYNIESVALERGTKKSDEYFGEVEVFYKRAKIVLVLVPLETPPPDKRIEINLVYQGCADAGLCYPPITKAVVLEGSASP